MYFRTIKLNVLGVTTGFADLMLWPFFERLELLKLDEKAGFNDDFPPKDKYPKLNAYYSRMKMQPEVNIYLRKYNVLVIIITLINFKVKIAIRSLDQHAAFIQSYLTGEPNYDVGIEMAKL